MDQMLKTFFDKKLGDFLLVDKQNMQFSPGSGVISLRQAEFRAEVFEKLHLPVELRGGYIEEMSVSFASGVFSSGGAKVRIKDVCLILGPAACDWSWEQVFDCKSKLVDLIMKVYGLKGGAHKPSAKGTDKVSYLGELKRRMTEGVAKHLLGMLEVDISNIHIRYEDALTQASPFACGFKIGFICVTSSDHADENQMSDRATRASGEWKHSGGSFADPLFNQAIATRRISAYWDTNKETSFPSGTLTRDLVKATFRRLNLRETFSACVVDEVLKLYPSGHRRRKYLEGPMFRERLDFHQYVLFPASCNAHVVANRVGEAALSQKAPQKDIDVIFEPVEVAVDTEQIRSVNEVIGHLKKFWKKDQLFQTRPQESIGTYLDTARKSSPPTTGLSTSFRAKSDNDAATETHKALAEKRQQVVRAWWHHAYRGVLIACGCPVQDLSGSELRQKARLRERYIALCHQLREQEKSAHEGSSPLSEAEGDVLREIRSMQVRLPLSDVLAWRLRAMAPPGAGPPGARADPRDAEAGHATAERGDGSAQLGKGAAEEAKDRPNTLQMSVNFKAFQAYCLIAVHQAWFTAMQLGGCGEQLGRQRSWNASQNRRRRALTRPPVLKADISDVWLEVVQRGHSSRRIARWIEVRVGNIGAINCSARERSGAGRILQVAPLESQKDEQDPVCVYLALTMLGSKARGFEEGDIPLTAVLEPWAGVAGHLKPWPRELSQEHLDRLGCLREHKDEAGRLMTFAFVRTGMVQLLDHVPFRRRLMALVQRGLKTEALGLVRRPSHAALDRELLVKLQRKVQTLTGKSDMMGFMDGVFDGVRTRMVDAYNGQHVLCKEAVLGATQIHVLRNGKPQTFQVQLHQAKDSSRNSLFAVSSLLRGGDAAFGLMPWKVAVLLLPKADFAIGMGFSDDRSDRRLSHSTTQSKAPRGASAETIPELDVDALPDLAGTWFVKWGRNGKCRRRYVTFDASLEAITWRLRQTDRECRGAIPLGKIQDVSVGVRTPVLKKARKHSLMDPMLVFSVVSTDRTLDLQAESTAELTTWASWLRARYRHYVKEKGFDAGVGEAVDAKLRSYPFVFRPAPGELCGLRTTCKKLQAVSSIASVVSSARS